MKQIQSADFTVIHPNRTAEFINLFQQFLETFYNTDAGQRHYQTYAAQRETGQQNWELVQQRQERGESIVDAVLLKLLPYVDNPGNRDRGGWIHIAPVFSTDVRIKQEAIGWKKPEDWEGVATAIADFVSVCVSNPSNLESACKKFIDLPFTKGFQTGTLTPILNALCPQHYALINNKSRRIINYFANSNYEQHLSNYPETNATALQFRQELAAALDLDPVSAGDLLDMFSHWLVSIKKFFTPAKMGAPFSEMFESPEQASWASDWLRFVADTLGVTGPDDLRAAMIYPKTDTLKEVHFVFGSWLVLGFFGRRGKLLGAQIALFQKAGEKITGAKSWKTGQFKTEPGDEPVLLYDIPIGDFQTNEGQIKQAFVETSSLIKHYFSHWKSSNLRDTHHAKLAALIFDLDQEEAILQQGIEPLGNGGDTSPIQDPIGPSPSPLQNPAFSPRAFELLEGLHHQPRMSYYNEHKAEFKSEIEQPLQELMSNVAPQLPEPITKMMETQKKIFSRFNKNDFGQGGAWEHYWGAFYPKGSKRSTDAQLAVFMQYRYIQISFYIGDNGYEVRNKFKRNCNLLKDTLPVMLKDLVDDPQLLLIRRDDGFHVLPDGQVEPIDQITWDSFFADPLQVNCGVRLTLSPQQVFALTTPELEDLVVKSFQRFFPLVILSQSDNPMEDLQNWFSQDEESDDITTAAVEPYTLLDCARDTGFDVETLERWLRAVERKKQAILYGPPGTGKTFVARALAKVLADGDEDRVELVQFHPAYSYEDFIQGIRPKPVDGGLDYPIVPGRFLEFCNRARNQQGIFVLIIDEINRANLARVFGELMYLLEYRGEEIPLAGGSKKFSIPSNVRLIGTMNTADHSIALVDHALRRRFAFLGLAPNYAVLLKYHAEKNTGFPVENLVKILRDLNGAMKDPHYEVGISFFLRSDLAAEIEDIWKMEIEPYLEEYFYEDPKSIDPYRWDKVVTRLGI